jgi:(R,R)-butanediol dehydrogenase/meso-butanediol dehydrogenase/diacetyl reductase
VGGAGPMGLLTAAVLKGMGATVIVSELSAARKDTARDSGVADPVLDSSTEDVKTWDLEITHGIGADTAFGCVGINAVLHTLLDALKPTGVLVNVSVWGRPATVDMQKVVLKEFDARGTIAYVRDHAEVIELVGSGKIDLKPFIAGRIALEDLIDKGFHMLINHNEMAVKIIVSPSGKGL